MERKRQVGPSSSSPSADIFGLKESSPSTASVGTFASIFPPPQTALTWLQVAGRKLSSELTGSRVTLSTGNHAWNSRQANFSGVASANMPGRDSSFFLEERGEPCHLSSSLYYGGQDVYSHTPINQTPGTYTTFNDGEKVDPNGTNSPGASRGNWWQGSLYY